MTDRLESARPNRVAGAATARSTWKSVAIPSEHGGWGLTLEPGLLGILLAPATSSLWLALAAMTAFLARTPIKVVAVDLRRGRVLERTRLAALVALGELAVLATLATAAVLASSAAFWWPVAVAAPLVAVQGAYEIRSRGRRLVPEVAGSVGVCAVAAMAVLADGGTAGLALGAWLVLAGRAVSSVTWVRGQIMRLHGRAPDQRTLLATDALALSAAATAVAADPGLWLGALGVVAVIAVQRAGARGEPMRPALQGMQQMAMGLGVVILAATGVLIA